MALFALVLALLLGVVADLSLLGVLVQIDQDVFIAPFRNALNDFLIGLGL